MFYNLVQSHRGNQVTSLSDFINLILRAEHTARLITSVTFLDIDLFAQYFQKLKWMGLCMAQLHIKSLVLVCK